MSPRTQDTLAAIGYFCVVAVGTLYTILLFIFDGYTEDAGVVSDHGTSKWVALGVTALAVYGLARALVRLARHTDA